ncbi:MAG: HipA domain-containing protein [Methanomassiliicoccaceae archaeon]|nr:HipA domain-containing protein [Methanomassiliicoccaceae archaeon]
MTEPRNTFNGRSIRSSYSLGSREWLFSAVDVVAVLADPANPRKYWNDIKRRLKEGQLSAKIGQLKMLSADGKSYNTDVLNVKGTIELARHIRSAHTEAFVRWIEQFYGEKRNFVLKHKDIDVAEVGLDERGSISSFGKVFNDAHLPVGTVADGHIDTKAIKEWWGGRSIPASREGLRDFLETLGMFSPKELLDKSLGLSLSDQYWICPHGADIQWKKVNFFHNEFSEDIGDLLFGKRDSKDVGAIDLTSPDNTSDGVLKKKWKIIDGKRCLIKGGSKPNNQEVANEVLASRICERLGIPYVNYEIMEFDNDRYSVCEDFITGDAELIPAYRIKTLIKKENNVSDYESYIAKVEELGIPDVRERIDMMLVLDFIMANTDRHYNNFGLVRNADTLDWISVAPIYDSGTSMWCREFPSEFNTGREESKPFRSRHRDQIKLVSDFSWLDLDSLDGIENEYAEILSSSVKDPSALMERNKRLCSVLRERVNMLRIIAEKKQKMN